MPVAHQCERACVWSVCAQPCFIGGARQWCDRRLIAFRLTAGRTAFRARSGSKRYSIVNGRARHENKLTCPPFFNAPTIGCSSGIRFQLGVIREGARACVCSLASSEVRACSAVGCLERIAKTCPDSELRVTIVMSPHQDSAEAQIDHR